MWQKVFNDNLKFQTQAIARVCVIVKQTWNVTEN